MALSAAEQTAANALLAKGRGCGDIALMLAIAARAGIDPSTVATLVDAKFQDVYALIRDAGWQASVDPTKSQNS